MKLIKNFTPFFVATSFFATAQTLEISMSINTPSITMPFEVVAKVTKVEGFDVELNSYSYSGLLKKFYFEYKDPATKNWLTFDTCRYFYFPARERYWNWSQVCGPSPKPITRFKNWEERYSFLPCHVEDNKFDYYFEKHDSITIRMKIETTAGQLVSNELVVKRPAKDGEVLAYLKTLEYPDFLTRHIYFGGDTRLIYFGDDSLGSEFRKAKDALIILEKFPNSPIAEYAKVVVAEYYYFYKKENLLKAENLLVSLKRYDMVTKGSVTLLYDVYIKLLGTASSIKERSYISDRLRVAEERFNK